MQATISNERNSSWNIYTRRRTLKKEQCVENAQRHRERYFMILIPERKVRKKSKSIGFTYVLGTILFLFHSDHCQEVCDIIFVLLVPLCLPPFLCFTASVSLTLHPFFLTSHALRCCFSVSFSLLLSLSFPFPLL